MTNTNTSTNKNKRKMKKRSDNNDKKTHVKKDVNDTKWAEQTKNI